MPDRPRLTPAIADVRRAVREAIADLAAGARPHPSSPNAGARRPNAGAPAVEASASAEDGSIAQESPAFGQSAPAFGQPEGATGTLVLVALSGGPDSLALAAATAFEAARAGMRAGAVIVDHGLQPDSAAIADRAAAQATALGLAPVLVRRATVASAGGPEAAARAARYAAFEDVAAETGAAAVLLAHTLDDQAETVLLGLARGSGPTSLSGMQPVAGLYRRPLLAIRRATTHAFCADAGLTPWHDPHNDDRAYARVRVRLDALPVLERELGPGIAEALARTAEQLREDDEALNRFAEEVAEDLAEHTEAGIALPVAALEANPPALRQRLIRLAVEAEFHVALTRAQTLEVARLVTDWHGQSGVDLPRVRVERRDGLLHFTARDARPDARP